MHNAVTLEGKRAIVDMQLVVQGRELPSAENILSWVEASLEEENLFSEVVVRIVDEAESAELNEVFRKKTGPTNVLSFPFDMPPEVSELKLLGDLVICAPVVAREAIEQHKEPLAHWAHMVVHGTLHLQGYDHLTDEQAKEMEGLEQRILTRLGYPDPYHEED